MSLFAALAYFSKDESGRFTVQRNDFGTFPADAEWIDMARPETWPQVYLGSESTIPRDGFEADSGAVRHGWGFYRPLPTHYKLLPWRNPAWREDLSRFLSLGRLPRLPWDVAKVPPIEGHFAHIGMMADGKPGVGYFESEDRAAMGRVTVIKAGRYLARFYPSLTGDEVRELGTLLDKANDVRFAESADDMETVYTNGPHSCMAYQADDFSSPFHPVRVYAAGDLQVAYLSSVDLGADGFRASARALVWPAKKLYGRIYGDTIRLSRALQGLGYSEAEDGILSGARMLKVEAERGAYVMPYVDGCQRVSDMGEHFMIDEGGEIKADQTNGLTNLGRYCPGLEDVVDMDEDFSYVRDLGEYCSDSYINEHCFFCDYYEEYFSDNHGSVYMENGETWSQRAFDRHGVECERSGENIRRDEAVRLVDTNELVSEEWAADNAHEVDGDWYAEAPDTDDEDGADEAPTGSHGAPVARSGWVDAADFPLAPGMRVRFKDTREHQSYRHGQALANEQVISGLWHGGFIAHFEGNTGDAMVSRLEVWIDPVPQTDAAETVTLLHLMEAA